jgi:hypothetical protein
MLHGTFRTTTVCAAAPLLIPAMASVLLAAAACTGGPTAGTSAPPTTRPATAAPTTIPPGVAAPVTGPYAPTIDPARFTATVDNPYFPLRPGMRWEYRSNTADGVESTVVTVTNVTKTIMGVPCVEVRDTVKLDGALIEDTLDWFAQHRDGTVWYFGEDTKEYENGKVSTTKGSWTAGVGGAMPGIVMPAQPQVGDRYRQEFLQGEAEDMADVQGLAEMVTVPTGSYTGVVKTKDYTPLEPDATEFKYYARGVGAVLTVDANGGARDELVKFSG